MIWSIYFSRIFRLVIRNTSNKIKTIWVCSRILLQWPGFQIFCLMIDISPYPHLPMWTETPGLKVKSGVSKARLLCEPNTLHSHHLLADKLALGNSICSQITMHLLLTNLPALIPEGHPPLLYHPNIISTFPRILSQCSKHPCHQHRYLLLESMIS